MSETKAIANVIVAEREKLRRKYEADVASLDAIELAAARAEQLAVEWKNSAAGRDSRVWIYSGVMSSVTLVLVLNRGDEFGIAAEHFAYSVGQLASAFPEGWEVKEDEEVKDATYSADTAGRSIGINATPPGRGYRDSVYASVRVELPVGEGDACRVIKIGERPACTPSYSRPTPVYKALCPGDPLPLPLGGA